MISIGAYRRGANRVVDAAVEMREAIEELFRQRVEEKLPWADLVAQLQALADQCQTKLKGAAPATQPQLAASAA